MGRLEIKRTELMEWRFDRCPANGCPIFGFGWFIIVWLRGDCRESD